MNQDITTRLLVQQTDLPAFRDLRIFGLKESPRAFMDNYEEALSASPYHFKRHFKNGFVAGTFIGERLVGIAGLALHQGERVKHKATIWGVYVHPDARGKNAARAMIALLEAQAKAGSVELIQLSTDETNTKTTALYKSLGYESYGVEKHLIKIEGGYVDEVLMVKFLT